jgi:hypothetical protein
MGDTWTKPVYYGNPQQAVETDLGLGRGVYLADRGLTPGAVQVTIEPHWSVLNLVDGAHSRAWRDFENKVSPMEGRSHRAIMSRDSQSYSRMVKLFASMNNINIEKYDIVVGPNYRTGGTLVCTKNKIAQNHIRRSLQQNSMNSPGGAMRKAQISGATMLLDYWFTGIVKYWQNERAKAEGEKIYGQVKAVQAKDPTLGALIRFAWLTTRLNDSSGFVNKSAVISAQEVFQYADVYFDTSHDRALKRMHGARGHVEMRASGAGVYRDDWRNEVVWIEPSQVRTSPVGWWKVQIGTSSSPSYVWHYQFLDGGVVTWVDPASGDGGKGRWTVDGGVMRIAWPSGNVEEWEFPFRLTEQSGFMQWKGARHDFIATSGASAKIEQTATDEAKKLLVGTWDVWIGNKGQGWNGLFKFTAKGGASWAEKAAPK